MSRSADKEEKIFSLSPIHEEDSKAMEATSAAPTRKRRPASSKDVPKESEGQSLEYRHRAQSVIESKALDELESEVFESGLYENVNISVGSSPSVMAAEVLYSYLWWSVLQSLPAVVWFYPLCAMEISGFESVALLWLSPILLGVGLFRRCVSSPLGLMFVRALTMIGVASYQAPTTLSRLLILAVGNMFAMLTLAGSWWDKSKLDRHRHIYLHMLGYLLFLAIRVWGSSFNFIFMSHTYNNMASIVGLLLSIFLYVKDDRTPVVSTPPPDDKNKAGRYPGLISMAIGFGGLLYLTQLLYGEVSVVTRWAVAPYPDHGPNPHPWGMVTMLAATVGVILFGHQTDLLTSWMWTIVGVVFSMILYFMCSYTAFFGGIILGVYTFSLWPLLAKRSANFPPHKIIPLSMVVVIFYMLLSAWVVAYNFVPGGTLTRERSDVMLVMLVLSCGLASRNSSSSQLQPKHENQPNQLQLTKKQSKITLFGRVFRRLSTVAEEAEGDEAVTDNTPNPLDTHQLLLKQVSEAEEKETQKFHSKILKASLMILLLALFGFMYRIQGPIPPPQKEQPNVISAGIWAFHFGYDNTGWPSMEKAAQLIENTEVDVIGLLETDAARPYIGNHDIASWLSERLHMYVDYGPGTDKHTWGTMVLSKYPILKSEHHMLPSPEGEIAPAILATMNISGNLINFYIVHFGNDVDELDRKLQAEKSAEILANSTYPVIMLSYITNPPGSRDYKRIVNHGRVKDIDSEDWHRWCEYIFYRDVIKLGYARVSNGGLSDTEVQIGKFLIKSDPKQPDNTVMTQNPNEVQEWIRFPKMFGELFHGHYGDQSRHHFHMSTPKYFTT